MSKIEYTHKPVSKEIKSIEYFKLEKSRWVVIPSKWEEKLKLLKAFLETHPNNIPHLEALAHHYVGNKYYGHAIQCMKKVSKYETTLPENAFNFTLSNGRTPPTADELIADWRAKLYSNYNEIWEQIELEKSADDKKLNAKN